MKKINKLKKSKMNMGIVIPLLEKYGGAERYLIECVFRWQHRHDITIYSTSFNQKLLDEHGISKDVSLVELSPYFEGENSMVLNALLLPKIWKEEIGNHDIYHTHLWPTHIIDLHPMVWYPHEPLRVLYDLRYEQNVEAVGKNASRNIHIYPKYNYDRIGDSIYNATLSTIDVMDKASRPDHIVANSKYTAGYLEDVYNCPVKDIVYPGVEPENFIELPVDRNLFVTISQLWPHKRINLLLESIALTDEAQLMVIGNGPEKERLIEIAEKLGIEDRIFFLSGLSNKELSLVLARACAFLFSPIKEPFGIVVLEAMAAGKPIIAVNEGGYTEVCNENNAFLVPAYPSVFAEKISFLQENPDVARKMGEQGRKTAPYYTWSKAADELEDILIKVWEEDRVNQQVDTVTIDNTLVGIQYYMWFGEGFGAAHWNDNLKSGHVSDKSYLGYYSSTKGQIIEKHLDLFEYMCLDYITVNLHVDEQGVNSIELMGIQHLFDIIKIQKRKIKVAIQIAPYSNNIEELSKTIKMISKLYSEHPNYLKINDKPILFWFWTSAYDGDKNFIGDIKIEAEKFSNIAVSLRLPDGDKERNSTFGLFDGFTPFSPLELCGEAKWNEVWTEAYNGSKKSKMKYKITTVSPGYDDSGMDDDIRNNNPYRVIDRKNGGTYQKGFDFILGLEDKPDMIMISTFNEFHENSHIEPSLENGNLYIDMTKDFVSELKKGI
ncbi:glycosyltransferase [Vibrio spartinae]|uniref:GDP-mannose-dependent alpha-(1-6)-phosphatidylinositol monomannoside mannosyltransferase n=1 Tax=Vibrio spartinae TaxID=1918945 RepID=A0ABX6QV36_9VIBR|nr:glycosyltransferase [Vibrio spartinae]QMV12967.1 GDP-mannose-dependent alpha-(1-6)-phosphatidylinositol monomannoside mannosyltransferase [Vibrio spartinae]